MPGPKGTTHPTCRGQRAWPALLLAGCLGSAGLALASPGAAADTLPSCPASAVAPSVRAPAAASSPSSSSAASTAGRHISPSRTTIPASDAAPTEAQLARWSLIASQTGRDSDGQALRQWAQQGLPAAQREWGWSLTKLGRDAEALTWLAQASRQGDAQASFWLAGALQREAARQSLPAAPAARQQGLRAAQAQARQCLTLAARQGHAEAALQLSQMLASLPGRSPRQQAQAWLSRAAELGQPQAQFLLAMSLLPAAHGPSDPQRTAQGLQWLERAADQHHGPALQALALWRETQAAGRQTPDPDHQQAITDLWREAREEARNRWHR